MQSRPPIFIGITGRRQIGDAFLESVTKRLAKTFRQLDRDFPHVPKVLLTGAAYGADTIPIDLIVPPDGRASELHDWSVVLVLPFDRELYRKDFRAQAEDSEHERQIARDREARFDALLALSDRRMMVRQLPYLSTGEEAAAIYQRLDRDSPRADARLRHEHYEQLGQFIADTANLLIAVMDRGESSGSGHADGGTERVVAFRLAGRPDEHGEKVARQSSVLRRDWGALVEPPTREVWLIEPRKPVIGTGGYPLIVLPPVERARGNRDDRGSHRSGGFKETGLLRGTHSIAEQRLWLRRSLATARAIDRFDAGLGRRSDSSGVPVLSAAADPVSELTGIREAISVLQRRAKRAADNAFRTVAILFVCDVICLDLFSGSNRPSVGLLATYLLLFVATLGVILLARFKEWQPIAEDYRALNEMLRVQRAWWCAGLVERVDRNHLQSPGIEARRIRDSAAIILNWVWLRSPWQTGRPSETRWNLVRGTHCAPRPTGFLEQSGPPFDWVGSQIWYFSKHHRRCDRIIHRFGALTWTVFAASGWLTSLMCLWLGCENCRLPFVRAGSILDVVAGGRRTPALEPVVWLIMATCVLWLWTWSRGRVVPGEHTHHGSGLTNALSVLVGLAVAIMLACGIQAVAGLFSHATDLKSTSDLSVWITMLVFVSLTAIAGAIQYVLDKLNFEAEALEYHDALRLFERAERLLAEGSQPGTGAPADEGNARAIVRDLALLALRENEAWLKARRERPLTPVIG